MTTAGALPQALACSSTSLRAGEPLAGSAPTARSWIVIEEPGPWGRDALRDSGVPVQVAEWLDHVCEAFGTKAIVARHDTRRRLTDEPRNVWLAVSDPDAPGGPQMRHTMVDHLRDIMQWDLSPLAEGRLPNIGTLVATPQEFVCTHSGRDACCARLGRARALHRPQAWECSHLGGHRFAATCVVLPSGAVFGRLGPEDEPDTEHLRGASYLPSALQVAEIAVRRYAQLPALTPLFTRYASEAHEPHATPDPNDSDQTVAQVSDARDNTWQVRCETSSLERPASCNTEATTAVIWQAIEVTTIDPTGRN